MGWSYLLDDRLREFNRGREARGRRAVSWADVAHLLGLSRQALQNLASNRELKVTNTRHLEALCRFFGCGLNGLMMADPEIEGPPADDLVDRLLSVRKLAAADWPDFHVDVLYGEAAQRSWKARKGGANPGEVPMRRGPGTPALAGMGDSVPSRSGDVWIEGRRIHLRSGPRKQIVGLCRSTHKLGDYERQWVIEDQCHFLDPEKIASLGSIAELLELVEGRAGSAENAGRAQGS